MRTDRDVETFYYLRLHALKPPDFPRGYPRSPKTLGERIRKRRLDLELTQAQLAERLGVNEWTVLNWEKGHTAPALAHLPALGAFLDDGALLIEAGADFPERLRAARRARGWSQERLARELGVDPSTVAGWERGEHRPIGRLRERIRSVLGTGIQPA